MGRILKLHRVFQILLLWLCHTDGKALQTVIILAHFTSRAAFIIMPKCESCPFKVKLCTTQIFYRIDLSIVTHSANRS